MYQGRRGRPGEGKRYYPHQRARPHFHRSDKTSETKVRQESARQTRDFPSDYDLAGKFRARIFYESGSDTIRTWPENYCLAIRQDECWVPCVNAGIGQSEQKILTVVISRHRRVSVDVIVDLLTKRLADVSRRRR